jgi:hypothetical protein
MASFFATIILLLTIGVFVWRLRSLWVALSDLAGTFQVRKAF